jgi:hypothetical protein
MDVPTAPIGALRGAMFAPFDWRPKDGSGRSTGASVLSTPSQDVYEPLQSPLDARSAKTLLTARNSSLDGPAMDEFEKNVNDLASADPKAAAGLMALLQMIEHFNPELAGKFISGMNRIFKIMQQGQAQSGAAAQSIQNAVSGASGAPAASNSGGASNGSYSMTIDSVRIEMSVENFQSTSSGPNGQIDVQGQRVSISIQSMHVEFQSGGAQQGGQQGGQQSVDPLVLDIQGNGIDLTGAANGAYWDLTGSGKPVQAATVRGDDGLLFIDKNRDGRLTNGKELFGDQTGYADGYANLSAQDANRDGVIDKRDPVFTDLRVYRDPKGDGNGEVFSLAQLGISSLDLNSRNVDTADANGNRAVKVSSFQRADGSKGLLADIMLRYNA